jgi:hypothetical protein
MASIFVDDISNSRRSILEGDKKSKAPRPKLILLLIWLCVFCAFGICICTQGAVANPQSADKTPCGSPDWFAVRRDFLERKQLTDLCKGQLDASEGNTTAAESELTAIIHKSPDSEAAYQARSTLAHLYFRQGRFREARTQVDAMAAMKPGAADLQNVQPLYELLATSADLEVVYGQPSTIDSKTIDGNVFAQVVVDGSDVFYMLDCGLNLSMMSESEAARLHLMPQSVGTRMSDIGGKVSAPLSVVFVDKLTVGATHLRHAPFLVVPDTNGAFEGIPQRSRGILGIQPLIALRTLGFEAGGKLRVGGKTRTAAAETPLLFDGEMPLTQIVYQNKSITVTFDSGATQTTFNPPFVKSFPEVLRAGSSGAHTLNGLSGTTETRSSTVPQLVFVFGREIKLSPATILLDETAGSSAWAAANLGYDSMVQAVPFTIDFQGMRIVFERPENKNDNKD